MTAVGRDSPKQSVDRGPAYRHVADVRESRRELTFRVDGRRPSSRERPFPLQNGHRPRVERVQFDAPLVRERMARLGEWWTCLATTHASERSYASSPQRQVQRQRGIPKRSEAESLVEAPRGVVLGIHDERVRSELLANLQATIDRAAQKQLAQAAALLIASACQSAHANARNGIAWQSLSVRVRQTLDADFGGAERVVPKDLRGRRAVDQHVGRADALLAVLLGESLEVLVQRRDAAIETLSIVHRRVERLVLKHAAPVGVPASAPA